MQFKHLDIGWMSRVWFGVGCRQLFSLELESTLNIHSSGQKKVTKKGPRRDRGMAHIHLDHLVESSKEEEKEEDMVRHPRLNIN